MTCVDGRRGETMTSHQRLLVRPACKHLESSGGFLLRLAHVNGIRPIWGSAGDGSKITSPGLGIARWCPHCLSAPQPYWRKDWTDGPAICLEHRCWLLDQCTVCGKPATWRGLRFRRCRCGADLAHQPASPWSTDLAALLELRDLVAVRHLDALDLDQRWALAEVLGALGRYGLQGKPIKRTSTRLVSHQRDVVERGASCIVYAAEEMATLLERLRAPCRTGQQAQLAHEAWPGLLRLLRAQLNGAALGWALSEIDRYTDGAALQGVPIQRTRRHGGAPSGASALAASVGIRVERVPELLADCKLSLPTRQSRAGRRMLVVDHAAVSVVRQHLNDHVAARSAQRRFGLAAGRLAQLAETSLVQRTGNRFSVSSIQCMLDRISGIPPAAAATQLGSPDWVPLDRALRLLVPQAWTVEFFQALEAGALQVRCCGERTHRAAGLQVIAAEVKVWISSSKASDDFMLIPQAAALLGLKQEVAYHLVRVGLIATSNRRLGRRVARVISQRELDRFRSAVSPLSEVARANGINFRAAKAWAVSQGITLVSGPGLDGGRQFFVRNPSPRLVSGLAICTHKTRTPRPPPLEVGSEMRHPLD